MDKPFIKLFHTPNNGYFLDVNKNELVRVSGSSYEFLSSIMSGKNGSEDTIPQELIELKSCGYLTTESNVKEVRHPYSAFAKDFLERKVNKITLQVTQSCNMRCRYCIYDETANPRQRKHSNKRMSWDIAKCAIDFLWDHSVDSPKVNVGFYGGEPLLEFSMIKKVVEYSEKRFYGKPLSFSITTNGTMLDDEKVRYMQRHNIGLLVSLDGPKEINDRNRVFKDGRGTYDIVMENIERLRVVSPDYASKLQISMVIDPENDFDCINSIFLNDAEMKSLSLISSTIDYDYDDKKDTVSSDYVWKSEYQRFLGILSYYGRISRDSVSPIVTNALTEAINNYSSMKDSYMLNPVDAPSGPCIPGQMRLFVNALGKLYPCERVSETSSAMCIGSLFDGFDLLNVDKLLNVGRMTGDHCRKCWCFRHCVLCAKKAVNDSGILSAERKLTYCKSVMENVIKKIKLHLLLMEVPVYYGQQARGTARK